MFDVNNIGKMMEKLSKMQSSIESDVKQDEKLKNSIFIGSAGDNDLGVKVQINGNKEIKSIDFSNGLKEFIHQSPEDFWQVLTDLIIAAFSNATSQIKSSDAGSDESDSDFFNQINEMTKNLGGMENIMKSLGGGNSGDLMKNMSGLLGGFNPKKKK
jgi:DNA-binding protein YbaB